MVDADALTIDALGYLAAGIVFLTFCMKTMLTLRVIAIVSNIAFIAYALAAGLTPILVLHGALLPMNVARLVQMQIHVRRASAAAQPGPGEERFDWLIPHGTRRDAPPPGRTGTGPAESLNAGGKPGYNHRLHATPTRLGQRSTRTSSTDKERAMARVCPITGKKPLVGNRVSHANNKTKRRFMPNLQNRRFWVESENRWVSLRLSNAALRTIDKKGIDVVLAELRAQGRHL